MHSYAEESAGGLLFTSSAEKVDKRTSMCIFADKLQKIDDSFDVSFDLSIWDTKQFGHIFRVINEQKKEVEFVFVNFYGTDKMYLDFHSPITHKSVQIPISKETIEKKELLHLNINFNLKEDKASITLNDSVYTCAPVGLENPSFLQFAFGLYGLNLDVPQMLIRDLRIQASNGKSYFFPLRESAGEVAYDELGKTEASVKNPEWIVNKHFYWQTKSTFNVRNKAYVTFDEKENRIIIVNNDSVLSYYPQSNKYFGQSLSGTPSNFKMIDAIFNPSLSEFFLLGYDSVFSTRLNVVAGDFSLSYIVPSEGRNLLHHNSFFSKTNELYQFGGYGDHTYSDKLYRFNNDELKWEIVSITGDKITPRFYSASGDGVNPDENLIFGGFGNDTGKQEHGGHNLYDLFVLNLDKKTITNLWSLHETPKIEFIPGKNLILNKDKTHFYVFGYAHHISKTTGYLYRFDLKDGSCEVVSDSIRINSEDMNTSVNLFFNKELNVFYAVVNEFSENRTTVKIYTLLSPSITKSQLENFIPNKKSKSTFLLILLFLSLMVVVLFYFLKRKNWKQNKKFDNSEKNIQSQNIISENKVKKQSAIYIFGNFTAFDQKGTDISYRFSMKLRALFSIILLYTNYESKISTEKLTSYMWPDKDTNEAKNIRGVTINRLRNILSDIDGISLVHENSHWHFVFNNDFYCDFLEYSSFLSRFNNLQKESYDDLMEKLVAVLNNGAILLNVQDQAIDNFKSKEEEKLEIILRDYIKYLFEVRNYKKIIQISPSYFSVEPLNEEVLEICLKAYTKLGKRDEAKVFSNNYKKTYKMMTGEDYPKQL